MCCSEELRVKVSDVWGLTAIKTFNDLYEWSVGDNRLEFWNDIWQEAHIIHEGSYARVWLILLLSKSALAIRASSCSSSSI